MVKITIKLYLEMKDIKKLYEKARDSGYEGKGMLSHYISKEIARKSLIALNQDVLKMLQKGSNKRK